MSGIIPAILMILTSTAQIDSITPTGLWYEEFAVPYEIFLEEGYEVTVASIDGGKVPLDPRSTAELSDEDIQSRAMQMLGNTLALDDVDPSGYDVIFFPGGHGTMFDFPDNVFINEAINQVFYQHDGIVAAVCHGPAAFVGVTDPEGHPMVAGRHLTGFTNAEEREVVLDEHMPFLLESKLRGLGANFVPGPIFKNNVVADGNLITGQNPASAEGTARAVVRALEKQAAED